MGTCFVLQPSDKGILDTRYRQIIEPLIVESGLAPRRVDERHSVCTSAHKIESAIHNCACVIAEVSVDSPEVWFWVGFATAHRKEVIFICNSGKPAPLLCGEEYDVLQYSADSHSDQFERRLSSRLRQALKKHNVFKTLAHSFPVPHLDKTCLSDSEMNVLQIVKESLLSPEECVMPNQVRSHMKHMGFFGHTITLALESLRDKAMIELGVEQGSFYRPYPVYQLTEQGTKWLEENYQPIAKERPSRDNHLSAFLNKPTYF